MSPRSKAAMALPAEPDVTDIFDLTPMSLWLEDYSGVKIQFEAWRRAGVTSLREHLSEDPERVKTCAELIRVIKVNAKTLSLYEAEDLPRLTANLDRVFRDDMLTSLLEELVQLWEGRTQFSSHAVNYTLVGAAARHSARRPDPAGLRVRLGASAGGDRRRHRARKRAPRPAVERGLCARACSIIRRCRFGSRISAASRCSSTTSGLRDRRLPHLHGRSSGIRQALHERDPDHRTSTDTRCSCLAPPTSQPCCCASPKFSATRCSGISASS